MEDRKDAFVPRLDKNDERRRHAETQVEDQPATAHV